nr:MAG TPA: helix-turn-helix domain protein [Caudoviricetes sp.]
MAEFITTNQAAKKLCISVETVYNMLRDGRLGGRYSKGNGKKKGSWLVSVESIELFKKHTTIKSIYQLKEKSSQGTLF